MLSTPLKIATQAEQEAGASATAAVTPARQHFHPSAAKMWLYCDALGVVLGSYNVASIVDSGTGALSVYLTVNFSSANYCVLGSTGLSGAVPLTLSVDAWTASAVYVTARDSAGALADPGKWSVAAFGDHA